MKRAVGWVYIGALVLAAGAALAAAAPSAHASYPGRDGRISYADPVVSTPEPFTPRTRTMLGDGSAVRTLGSFEFVSWTGSGRRLAAVDARGLLLADADGHVLRHLNGPERAERTAISRDGRTVAVVGSEPLRGPIDETVPWIWTVDAVGGAMHRVTSGDGPHWLPDGSDIVYESADPADGHPLGIASMRPDGSSRRMLVRDPEVRLLDVAPSGRRLLFLGRSGTRFGLFTSNLHGGRRRLLARATTSIEAIWSPSGRVVVYATWTGGGPRAYRVPAAGGSSHRITTRELFQLAWQPLP